MTDDRPRVFDLPHARITLTPVGSDVEIEVWPKQGQSAYAVVDPRVAMLVARHLAELASAQLASALADATDAAEAPDDDGAVDPAPVADNIVDLASRRSSGGGRAS